MKTLCTLLIEDDPDYAALVQEWISSHAKPAEFSLQWTDSLAAALARLDQGGVDLILMDLGLPDGRGLPAFAAVRAKAADLPIVVLSSAEDEALALETILHGAQDYLIKHDCSNDVLVRMMRHTMVRHKSLAKDLPVKEKPRGRMIAVISASGGAGATTIASVLAAELRHQTGQNTLLIDLDASPGLVAFTCGVEPQYTVGDAIENADRLDESIWEGLIERRPGDLEVLAATRAGAATRLDAEGTHKLLHYTAEQYSWILLDLGRLNHYSKQVACWADQLILTVNPSIPGLHQCKRSIEILEDLGVARDSVRLILNRRDNAHKWSPKEIQRLFGIGIDVVLPPSHQDLYKACLQKRLPAVTSDFRAVLAGLARQLARTSGASAKPQGRAAISLAGRLGFAGPAKA